MTSFYDPPPHDRADEEGEFRVRAPRSALPVLIGGGAIVLLGAAGFLKGFISAQPHNEGPLAPIVGSVNGAAPAVGLPPNPDWSTLNGPKISPAPEAKTASAEDDEDSDDSDSPEDQSAADAAIDQQQPPAAQAPKPAAPSSASPADDTAGLT